MNIILFGPPGAGKGTQASNLVKDFNLFKVSSGDILRKEIGKKSNLGNKIEIFVNKGLLVPDEIINELIENILSNKDYSNRLIFDGYPRNLDQAKKLDDLLKKNNQKISCVLSLKVLSESIFKRILGRQICTKCGLTFNEFSNPSNKNNHFCDIKFLQKRSDDNEKTIQSRFTTYLKETLPILNYYKSQNLLTEIDGMGEIVNIYKEIRQFITTLGTWLYNKYLYK